MDTVSQVFPHIMFQISIFRIMHLHLSLSTMDSAKSGELQKMIEILEKSLFTMNSAKSGKPQKMIEIFEKTNIISD